MLFDPKFGNLVSVHPPLPVWRQVFVVVGWIILLFPIVGAIVALRRSEWMVALVVMFPVVVGAAATFYQHKIGQTRRTELFENGVRILEKDESQFEALWTEVDFIQEQREGTSDEAFCGITLYRYDGVKYRFFRELVNFHPMKWVILQRVYEIKRAKMAAAFKRNEIFVFGGGLLVHRAGLEVGIEIIPWARLELGFESIYTVVRALPNRTKFWQMATSLVPNFSLLMELFDSAEQTIRRNEWNDLHRPLRDR